MLCTSINIAAYVLGFVFILAALGRAVLRTPSSNLNGARVTSPFDPGAWAELVKAIVEFIKVAPAWLLLFVAGLILLLVVPRYVVC